MIYMTIESHRVLLGVTQKTSFWGKKIAMCRIYIGVDHAQSNLEANFWHSKC